MQFSVEMIAQKSTWHYRMLRNGERQSAFQTAITDYEENFCFQDR